MSALRAVLLAEGNGESGPNAQRGPGSPIHVEDWGPGHELFARAIAASSSIPREAVQFLEPLRTSRGAIAKGSNLLHRQTLRRLLSYLPAVRPELAIVLIDADGDTSRKQLLEGFLEDIPGVRLIAVAIQEFESWLSCDGKTLNAVLSADSGGAPQQPEKLAPGEAKAMLQKLMSNVDDARAARINLARHIDLNVVASRCPGFATCLNDLASLKLR